MGCHRGMDTKELFFPRTFMRAPSSAPKTPVVDEQIRCGFMFTPSSMYPGWGEKSGLWGLAAAAEKKKDSGGDDFVSAGWPTQQTRHVTFEDEPDNGECAPMDISGE